MTRAYTQRSRAAAQEDRRADMIAATFAVWERVGFDGVTLQAVADGAGVSLKTVVRHFGTREGLLTACMRASVAREEAERDAPAGDVHAVVKVLADRYELIADRIVRNAEIEFRYPVMTAWVAAARKSHLDWLARAFTPWLPAEGPVREHRLMALYWATELRCWWTLRHALGQSREAAETVWLDLLLALVAAWSTSDSRRDG